ncbi:MULTISPECIES: iron-hydroxamate ABC transporter substrate-binding protein [unclassified Streptococcus]|uniref:iron-hydroxamate ABC transporter substrate-binding protein n=1 Tax=unclassified Streptococcus TaxID=2608887 RepID=UPI0018ABE010|nr:MULTISPECIES: iron-hydroxamate ABC transporter substrate-binding protein [unclassified Streptococcus]MBF8970994.1 iron-hydroxamate ABC transporter substrate-binding protein [Streptococcus sp. NLN76]MBG9367911.1 iron-hydroxamate ABC transporter substrate-binding protein [Streptococcus sp. NLN64]
MKKLLTWLGLGLLLVTLAACASSSSTSNAKVDVVLSSKPKIDGFDYSGDIPQNPQRIVSLSSSYTGYLYQLGFDPVSVTTYDAKNPVLKDRVKDAQVLMPEDLESIAKANPDLIVVESNDPNLKELQKIAPTLAVTYGKNDYLQLLNSFGQVFGKEKEADEWIANWKDRTAKIGRELRNQLGEDVTVTVMGLFEKDIYLFGNNWGRGGEVVYQTLGFKAPQKVQEEVFKPGYLAVNQDALPEYLGDIVVVAAENEETGSALYESNLWKSQPAVEKNRVLKVDANAFYFNDPLSLEYELKTIQEGFQKMMPN